MTLDEAISVLNRVWNDDRIPDDIGRAAEMGEMALSMLVERHDSFCEFMRFYNEIDEVRHDEGS